MTRTQWFGMGGARGGARALSTVLATLVLVALAGFSGPASAAARPVYTIVVGHNAVAPALQAQARGLVTLRYADDDALKFFALMEQGSRQAFLLAVPDADTQRRFPTLSGRALPPTMAALDRVVALLSEAIVRDRERGAEPELVFFFSGHGVKDATGAASLSLLDGALTRTWLYDRLLAAVPARFTHLVIDACHAEALVRPRDANATMETLEEAERESYVDAATLDRFPHVGAVLASTASAQSFEWDPYRGGVFAPQLLSGLRGGADVNADGVIEYSEIAAFLSAANLKVKDARARLAVVVRPPPLYRRAALLDITSLSRQFELRGRAEGDWAKGFYVETAGGERLIDVFPEQATRLTLRLPAGQRLFLVRPDAEVEIAAQAGGSLGFGSLKARPPRTRARGALDSALRDGLFATRFGPAFYQGYVSQYDELVAVPLLLEPADPPADPLRDRGQPPAPDQSGSTVTTALWIGSGAAAIATGVLAGLTLTTKSRYDAETRERPAHELRDRFYSFRTAAIVAGSVTVVLGGTSVALFVLSDADRQKVAGGDGFVVSVGGHF